MDYFKKGIFLGIGFMSVVGIVFTAAAVSVSGIPNKGSNGTVSFNEFNQILGTLQNIYNDNTNQRIGIGAGASAPISTLDIDGNLTIGDIKGCTKLGTNTIGTLICN